MRNFSDIMKMVACGATLLIAGSQSALAADTEPWVMTLTENYADLPDCNFTGTDDNGNIFGFRIYEVYNYDTWTNEPRWNATGVLAADSNADSITFPDMISFNYNGMDYTENLTMVDFRHDWNGVSFPEWENLKDIYLPATIEKIYSYGKYDDRELNIHLKSENVPYVFMGENSVSYVNLIVPDDKVDEYEEGLEGKYFVYGETAARPEYLLLSEGRIDEISQESNYSVVGKDGNLYAFSIRSDYQYEYDDRNHGFSTDRYYEATFAGVKAADENKEVTSFTVPEKVLLISSTRKFYLDVTRVVFNFRDHDDAFRNFDDMQDVYLPSSVTNVESKGSYISKPLNIHVTSEEPAEIYLVQNPAAWINIIVPRDQYQAYSDNLGERYFYYAEGSEINYNDLVFRPVPHNTYIWGCNYVGQDVNGNTYGFYIDCDSQYHGAYWASCNPKFACFSGMTSDNQNITSVTVPTEFKIACGDGLKYDNPEITDAGLYFDFEGTEGKSFPGMDNLKDIYFPPTITNLYVAGADLSDYLNLHLTSDEVPNIRYDRNAEEWMILYVPEDMFMTYDQALNDYYLLRSEAPAQPFRIEVDRPGTLADKIYELLTDINDIRWLELSGCPSAEDLLLIRRMYRLEILDLTGADITLLEKCGDLKYLYDIRLPETLEELGEDAFMNTRLLTSIHLPNSIKKLGSRAFYNCQRLANINMPDALESIEYQAFGYAYKLKEANLPASVHTIANSAFSESKLEKINLENVKTIGQYAFQYTNISKVDLTNAEGEIPWRAFSECRNLSDITLGEKITTLGYRSFADCPFDSIVLPRSLTNIDGGAFQGCRPTTVYSHILFPIGGNGFDGRDEMWNATLYVPHLTVNNYLLSDHWTNFAHIEPMDDSDLTDIEITQPFDLITNYGIADKANITNESEFKVNREYDLNLNSYTHNYTFDGYSYWWDEWYNHFKQATLVVNNNMTADNVTVNMVMRTGQWNFISLPFDVKVGEIVVDAQNQATLWVVRKYSGEDRAKLTDNTWQNMTDDMILKAGEGYIFHCSKMEGGEYAEFSFPAYKNGNGLFNKDEMKTQLAQYASEFAHNDSWNLVGNTYPAFVNIKGIDFAAPITVWEDETYYAYSPMDDDLILRPFQAFFAQRQDWEGGDAVVIKPAARGSNKDEAAEYEPIQTRSYTYSPDRAIFNVTVNGENGSDRARFVINEEASMNYERNCDAAKFMSTNESIPQLYVINNNVNMSIDERPLGNGEIALGAYFGEKGTYTIALNTRNAEVYEVILTDKLTGDVTNLSKDSYTFDAEKGEANGRFSIKVNVVGSIGGNGDTTGIDEVESTEFKVNINGNTLEVSAPADITVVSTDGKTVATANGQLSIELAKGIYVVKAGEETRKVVVGK